MKTVIEKKQHEQFNITYNQNIQLLQENTTMKQKVDELGVNEYFQTKEKLDSLNKDIQDNNVIIDKLRTEINELQIKSDKLSKSVATQERKVSRSKELYKSLSYAFDNFISLDIPYDNCLLSQRDLDDAMTDLELFNSILIFEFLNLQNKL